MGASVNASKAKQSSGSKQKASKEVAIPRNLFCRLLA